MGITYKDEQEIQGMRTACRLAAEVLDHLTPFIKPGLTGMWQVGGRSDLDWDESVRLDLYYVENWSLTGDIIILWRTARVLLNPVGAY